MRVCDTAEMPRCEGRSNESCQRNDSTLRFTQGDLFLCHDCEVFRFPSKHPKCIKSDPVNIEARKAATRNAGNVTDKLKAGIKGVITRSQKAECYR